MRPEVNQAARAYCEQIRIVRSEANASGAQFHVHVPSNGDAPRVFYWMKAKPAGQPNAETAFVLRLPASTQMVTEHGYYTSTIARYPLDETVQAFDLTFEPDFVAAESAAQSDLRIRTIPGQTFVIESVPIR